MLRNREEIMTSEKRERLLELFQVQPGYKILDITAHADGLTRLLAASLVPAGGRLSLVRYPGEHETIAAEEGMTLQVQEVADFDRPFRTLPRDNDIVFIRDVLHRHRYPERMLKAIYTTLANAAEIVIVTADGAADPRAQLQMLEAADFRAGSAMDDLAEGVRVVMGKKMHMWGNGL